jgi:hypothetical protein
MILNWQEISLGQTVHVSIGGGIWRSALGWTLSGIAASSKAAKGSMSLEQVTEILDVRPPFA